VVPEWFHNGAMAISLSIKEVPEDLAELLRERAKLNHRSIQGELMNILSTAVRPRPFQAMALMREVRALGLSTPDESAGMVRNMRDRR
jgi:plasmid stability protein